MIKFDRYLLKALACVFGGTIGAFGILLLVIFLIEVLGPGWVFGSLVVGALTLASLRLSEDFRP